MSKDSAVFFATLTAALFIALMGAVVGTAKMIQEEEELAALARVYRPEGCRVVGRVDSLHNSRVLQCGDRYEVIFWPSDS